MPVHGLTVVALPREPQLGRGFNVGLLASKRAIDIGKRSPAVPVTPPYMRVRIRRFGGLSDYRTVNLGIPSESK